MHGDQKVAYLLEGQKAREPAVAAARKSPTEARLFVGQLHRPQGEVPSDLQWQVEVGETAERPHSPSATQPSKDPGPGFGTLFRGP